MVHIQNGIKLFAAILLVLTVTIDQPASAGLLDKPNTSTSGQFNRLEVSPAARGRGIVMVLEQELDKFLLLAARQNGLALHVSGEVSGTLKNASLPLDIREMLPRLAKRFDLSWGLSGERLYVSPASDQKTATLSVSGLSTNDVLSLLSKAEPSARSLKINLAKDGTTVKLSGPTSQIDAIEHTLSNVRQR